MLCISFDSLAKLIKRKKLLTDMTEWKKGKRCGETCAETNTLIQRSMHETKCQCVGFSSDGPRQRLHKPSFVRL